MALRRPRRPVAALVLALVLAAGCSGGAGPEPPPAPAGAAASATAGAAASATADRGAAVDIASRTVGQPLPDVVGDRLDPARRALDSAGVRIQVVAFDDAGVVTAQHPGGGEPPPADGVVTLWVGAPAALPSPAPPPPPATAPPPPPPVAPSDVETPAAAEPAVIAEAAPPPPLQAPDGPSGEAEETDQADAPDATPRASGGTPSRSRAAGAELAGPATWYGPGFAGNRTACGGVFDPAALTMASRELPCGTRARVTGPSGRSVEVTVTDWGPAEWTGKRFDLSAAAFAEVANLSAGVVPVTVAVLD